MGRPAEVFVRPVTLTGGQRLQRIGRTARDPVKLRRAIVVLMSAQGQSVPDIAHLLDCSQEYVRTVIHAFNETGSRRWTQNGAGAGPERSVSRCGGRSACSPGAAPAIWGWRSARGA
jgi:Homeodomain-like domain